MASDGIGVWLWSDELDELECSECGTTIGVSRDQLEGSRWAIGQACEYCIEDAGGDRVVP